MSKVLLLVVFALLSLVSFSQPPNNNNLIRQCRQSLRVWRQLNPRQYTYIIYQRSWIGTSSQTDITVVSGKVVKRSYTAWSPFPPPGVVTDSWTEDTPESIGSHSQGAPAKTIRQLYQQCLNEVLTKSPVDNVISFAVDANGVIQTCSYTPKTCADDCAMGFTIQTLTIGT